MGRFRARTQSITTFGLSLEGTRSLLPDRDSGGCAVRRGLEWFFGQRGTGRAQPLRVALRGVGPSDDPRACGEILVGLSDACRRRYEQFEECVASHVYKHPRLVEMDREAVETVRAVFEAFIAEPGRLPKRFAERIAAQGAQRVVCDYVAGMTDRFCRRENERLAE